MRAKMLMPVLVLTGAAVFMPTRPVSGDTTFTLVGDGWRSCATWTQDRHGGKAWGDLAWVDGFISGVNWSRMTAGKSGRLGSATNQAGMDAWIDDYCQQHPLEKLTDAAQGLVMELEGHQ
jgi:hypothetical protein